MQAEFASAWGWTPADVNACVWHEVRPLLLLARRDKAGKRHDALLMARAVQGWNKDFVAWLKALGEASEPPKDEEDLDPRIIEARQMENTAKTALAFGNKAASEKAMQKAKYLRSIVKYGIQEGVND
jgi:hypothetical protein